MIDCFEDHLKHYMSQFQTGLAVTLVLTTTALMTACTSWRQYDITVNEVTIYAPATPLRVDGIEDPALRDCLQQTATDTEAQGVADLINLNCSAAGITTLAGLAQFDQIRSLKLSGNTIRNLLELARLEDLEQLWLDDNDIVDPVPVLRMTSLRALDLAGNPQLQCPSSDKVPLNLQLTLPDHCNAT